MNGNIVYHLVINALSICSLKNYLMLAIIGGCKERIGRSGKKVENLLKTEKIICGKKRQRAERSWPC